jgi:hypothetical protein
VGIEVLLKVSPAVHVSCCSGLRRKSIDGASELQFSDVL